MTEETYGWIYGLQSPKGKWYIGQTTEKDPIAYIKRQYTGKYAGGGRPKLRNALLKYGLDSFKITLICHKNDCDSLNTAEIEYIKEYDSIKNGYNCREGGKNAKLSEEHKKKLSIANKGKTYTDEQKKQMSITQTLRWTDEMKEARSREYKEKFISGEVIPVTSPMVEWVKQNKDKVSERIKDWWRVSSNKDRAAKNTSRHFKKLWGDDEYKNRMKRIHLNTSPDIKKKRADALREYKKNNETKVYDYFFIINGKEVKHYSLNTIAKEYNISIHILRHSIAIENYKPRNVNIQFISKTKKDNK